MTVTPDSAQDTGDYYVVPARTLRGSKAQMLVQIEEVVQALMALRLVILTQETRRQSSSAENR